MRTNYMMTVDDVMEELGVKRSKAYSILKQLNDELAKEGYVAVRYIRTICNHDSHSHTD